MDRWKVYKKCDEYRVRSPKNVADLIEIKSIAEMVYLRLAKVVFLQSYITLPILIMKPYHLINRS